jgi:hypothetical protein
MNDSPDLTPADGPASEVDELLRRMLDGEATPQEEAALSADPVLVEQLAAQRRVRAALAAPVVPLPRQTVDDMVARALMAADDADDAEGAIDPGRVGDHEGGAGRPQDGHPADGHPRGNPSDGAVVPLAGRSGRRASATRSSSRWSTWLAVASVAAVLGLAAVGLSQISSGRSDDAAAPGGASSSAGPTVADATPDRLGAGGDGGVVQREEAARAAPPPRVADLGPAASADELAARARDETEEEVRDDEAASESGASPVTRAEDAQSTAPQGAAGCLTTIRPGAPVELVAIGTVDGSTLDVVVLGPGPEDPGRGSVLVLSPGCVVHADLAR